MAPPKMSKRPRRLRKAMADQPNLTLETKDKDIHANIAVIGRATDEDRKAYLRVTSQQGKVHVDVKQKTVGRFFDLDVYSKKGNTTILVPHGFAGVIEVRHRKDKLKVRDNLASVSRFVRSSEGEALLLVGQGQENPSMADYVRCTCVQGELALGYSLDDESVILKKAGFWKKLFK